MSISKTHIKHYREHGFVIVENFLSDSELSRSRDDIEEILPGWLDYADGTSTQKPEKWNEPTRSRRDLRFPFTGSQLNKNTLHPELRRFASLMLGDDELFCEQSDLSYKCMGHFADSEQRMHVDYMNHTLVYPPSMPD